MQVKSKMHGELLAEGYSQREGGGSCPSERARLEAVRLPAAGERESSSFAARVSLENETGSGARLLESAYLSNFLAVWIPIIRLSLLVFLAIIAEEALFTKTALSRLLAESASIGSIAQRFFFFRVAAFSHIGLRETML